MLAKLGVFKFETNTAAYDKFRRSTKYNWAKQPRFGQNLASQFTGFGEETISISGTIYPEYKGGLEQLDSLRRTAKLGKPLDFAFGYGNVGKALGKWTIESITEEQMYFHTNGQPRKQTFSLELSRYE
jgi:phage protein U